jgi:isopenicillin N synthase-like dioxygenase
MVVKGMSQVPIVDISPFTSGGTLSSRQKAAKQLAEKIHLNGSAGISGHGVSPDILHKAFALAKRLFDLPYEDKMKAPHPEGMVPHRGYSGMGREQGAAKTALETDDDAAKDEYLNTSDYKVSTVPKTLPDGALLMALRKVTKWVAKRTRFSTTSGFPTMSCPDSAPLL